MNELRDFKNVPTPQQWHLRDLCWAQNLSAEWTCTPSWANGAVVLCTALDAAEIQGMLQDEVLRKGDVIVSGSLADFVRSVIESRHVIPGDSERPYRKQRPVLKTSAEVMDRQPLSTVVASEIRQQSSRSRSSPARLGVGSDDTNDHKSVVSRGTHTTGSQPRNQHAKGRNYGINRKKFKLTQFASSQSSLPEASPSAEHSLQEYGDAALFAGAARSVSAASEDTEFSFLTDDGQWIPDVARLIRDFCETHAPPQPLTEPEFLQNVADRAMCLSHIFERMLEMPAAHPKVTSCYRVDSGSRERHIEALTALHRQFCERVRKLFVKSNLAPFIQVHGDFESKSAKVASIFPDQLKRTFKKKSRADLVALPGRIPTTLAFTSPEELTDIVRVRVLDAANAALGESVKEVLENVMTKNEENQSEMSRIIGHIVGAFQALLQDTGKKWDHDKREKFRGQQKINAKFLASKR